MQSSINRLILGRRYIGRYRPGRLDQLGDMIGDDPVIFDDEDVTHGRVSMHQSDEGSLETVVFAE